MLTSPALCSISTLTSAEAAAADCASRRTSTATTAKPLPASPARAASTDAFSASKIGLEGDIVDQPDNVGDLARRGGDPLHRLIGLAHHRAALLGGAGDLAGIDAGFARPVGILDHRRSQLLHRRRRLLDGRRLLGGAFGQIVGAGQDFPGRGLERSGGALEAIEPPRSAYRPPNWYRLLSLAKAPS